MNVCAFTYVAVSATLNLAAEIWGAVTATLRQCTAQRCRWLCLCCNMWLCWIATTVVAVFLYVLWLVLFLLSVALVAICWKTCILAFFLNFGKATFNCIAGDPTPTPTPTPPPPSVSIAAPTTGTYFPDGDTVAITFRATATEPDGTPLAGSALLWERYLGTFPPTYDRLGTGTEIAVTLPHLPVDVAAGQPSSHTVRVTATGRNGVKADTDVHVSVGHIQID